jgi:hypothetical protein
MNTAELADNETLTTPPTHTVYTPKWEPGWDDETGQNHGGQIRRMACCRRRMAG